MNIPKITINDVDYSGASFTVVDEGPIVRITIGSSSVDLIWDDRVKGILDILTKADENLCQIMEK